MSSNSVAVLLGTIFCCTFCIYGAESKAQSAWTEWTNVTKCDGKPHGCVGDTKTDENDSEGHLIQMRVCTMRGFRACRGVSMRKVTCNNEKGACPGWSDWYPTGDCECEGDSIDGKRNGTRYAYRYCDNPPPLHKDVKCLKRDGRIGLEEESGEVITCQCEDDDDDDNYGWTTESMVTKIDELPCCNSGSDEDYSLDVDDLNVTQSSTTTTTFKPDPGFNFLYADYQEYDGETATCRPCNDTSSTTLGLDATTVEAVTVEP